MYDIGAGEGLRPLRTPDRGEFSPGPSITPAAPCSLSLDGRLDGARSDGEAFDGVLTPLNPRALPGRLDFLTPWHGRAPRNASCTDSPLRDRRSRRLWGNRTGRLIRPDLGSARWPSRQGSLWRERPRNGEGRWWILACTTSPCPVAHQRQKTRGRSLHFLALPARHHDAACEGVDTRCRCPTGLYPRGGGQSLSFRVQCGFLGTTWTTTARASPSESGALGLLKGRATSCATSMRRPPFVRWPPI